MNVFPARFGPCAYWSVGCCTSQSTAIAISGTWRFKNCFFGQRKTHNFTTYSNTVRIIESTEWWHSTRTTCPAAASYRITESTEWRHFNKTWRVSVTGGGDYYYYMYSIDCINYLSTTTKYQPEMPDYVNNNISGTSQLLRSTRYQVSRRKKDSERKEKKTK